MRVALNESGRAARENSRPATAASASAPSSRVTVISNSTPRRPMRLAPSVLLSKVPLVAVSEVMSLPLASVMVYWVALVKVSW
ncbi:hypothetical protein D9M71_617690 [compost metagenome]